MYSYPYLSDQYKTRVVESHLIRTHAAEMLSAAKALCQISTDPTIISLTDRVIKDLADVLQASANKATVEGFLPKRGNC